MLNFCKFIAVAPLLALCSVVLAPLPAAADHEQAPQRDPAAPPPPPPPAESDWPDGWYYMADFSVGDTEDFNTNIDTRVETDFTLGISLGFGYRLGPTRLEAEYFSDYHRVYNVEIGASSPITAGDYAGRMGVTGGMANIFIDLPASGRMRPYLGAGLGVAHVRALYNEKFCFLFLFCSTPNDIVDDSDWAHAWQAMAGFSHRTEGSNTEWSIGYRYFETEDLEFVTTGGDPFRQENLKSHTLNIGVRWYFG